MIEIDKENQDIYYDACRLFAAKRQVAYIARTLGKNRSTVHRWRNKWEDEGNYIPIKVDNKKIMNAVLASQDGLTTVEAEQVSVIRSRIPAILKQILDRMEEVASKEKNINNLASAFSKLAIYAMKSSDDDVDETEERIKYFKKVFNFNLTEYNNGQSNKTIDIGHKEER